MHIESDSNPNSLIREIPIDEVARRFKVHLGVEGNYRIIFSGPYGTGKSYFLNKFFDERKESYNKVVLSPVNYVVSSSEDIFELIKVDIIKELFFNNLVAYEKSEHKSVIDISWLMIHEKPLKVIKHILETIKKVNPYWETTGSVMPAISDLTSEYKKYEIELQKNLKLNAEQLAEFVTSFVESPGNIFEENFITRTINSELIRISESCQKENVLIIDDLDRIDPEHIFRILNILSAHNNYWDKKNKFKFHKIILVCDIKNIRNIFYHKYGKDVDFGGYIDKFFSTEVFHFSNLDAIKLHINNNIGNSLTDSGKVFLSFVLKAAVDKQLITIRKILKSQLKLPVDNHKIAEMPIDNLTSAKVHWLGDAKVASVYLNDLEILKVIKLLAMIWGDFNILKSDLKELKDGPTVSHDNMNVISNYIVLPLHIAQNFSKPQLLFSQVDEYNSHSRSNQKRYDYPTHNCFGMLFKIVLKWSAGNRYDSNIGYFENSSSCLVTSSDYSFNGMSENNDKYRTISAAVIFNDFRGLLDVFERLKFLQGMGL